MPLDNLAAPGQPPADWTDAAVMITPSFETAGDPYAAVSGDFDGMGISCGALQWNIGKGSLQPMVIAVGQAAVRAAMPDRGAAMWQACTSSIAAGLGIVRSWQNGTSLKAGPKAELRALMGTAAMRAEQRARIDRVAAKAFERASDWARASGTGEPSKRLFCWFFDVVTQNGSLEGLTPQRVADFLSRAAPGKADDLICDFLASRSGNSGHVRDAHRNGALWRDRTVGEKLEILCMSYLRSETASSRWRHVVLNRKGTIAIGTGWVNGSLRDFSARF